MPTSAPSCPAHRRTLRSVAAWLPSARLSSTAGGAACRRSRNCGRGRPQRGGEVARRRCLFGRLWLSGGSCGSSSLCCHCNAYQQPRSAPTWGVWTWCMQGTARAAAGCAAAAAAAPCSSSSVPASSSASSASGFSLHTECATRSTWEAPASAVSPCSASPVSPACPTGGGERATNTCTGTSARLCLAGLPCFAGEAGPEAQPRRRPGAAAGTARCCCSGEARQPRAAVATAKASAEGGLLPPPAAPVACVAGAAAAACVRPAMPAAACSAACVAEAGCCAPLLSSQAGMPGRSPALPVLLPPLPSSSSGLPRSPLPLPNRQAFMAAAAACSPDACSWRRRSVIKALRSPRLAPGWFSTGAWAP